MPIEFICSQCSSELKVRDADRGKKARCPRCGMIHEVPADVSGGADHVAVEDDEPSDTTQDQTDPAEQETAYRDPAADEPYQIDDDPGRWCMKAPDGRVYGPVHRAELDEWAAEGRISAACLLQPEGQTHWQSALVLYPRLIDMPRQQRRESGTRRRQGRNSRSHVGTERRQRLWRPNSGATVLVLAIVGVFTVSFPVFAIMAWVLGASERRAIDEGEASPNGRWMVDLGYYLGMVLTVIGIVVLLGCLSMSRI